MGLDRLGILFIIIILPISIVLNVYVQGQTNTLDMQLDYDKKLNNATYDAVKTFQLNSLNEDASSLGNVRLDTISASVSTFYNSLSANLNMSGYNREFLEQYVPAIVFTMYDGYYIYSKYTNTLGEEDYQKNDEKNPDETVKKYASTYQNGQQLFGLKPFIHYSCRYQNGEDDFVITYSLDNYITIQGIIDGKWINDAGYVIDITNAGTKIEANKVYYRNIKIDEEPILKDNLIIEYENRDQQQTEQYKYHKVNGVKYYYDESKNQWFSMLNGTRLYTQYTFDEYDVDGNKTFDGTKYDNSAQKYYKEAIEFTKRLVEYGITNLNYDNIVGKDNYTNTGNIFDLKGIEEPGSNFNQHRQDVIRYSIEKNLSIAIANYNTFEGGITANFQMPEFSEVEWDKIQSNICVISYLQGLPIGNKLYNGVSVIANNVNEEVVAENSINIVNGPNAESANDQGYSYYPITKKDWSEDMFSSYEPIGVSNVDLERRQVTYNNRTYYYYPKLYFDVYGTEKETVDLNDYNGNLYKYLTALDGKNSDIYSKVVKAYYTALGRERQSMYKQRNNYQELLNEIKNYEEMFQTNDNS